ncbi:MAG: type II secretion system secretin GspD [Deltaproteobacteria bacterium]|nr:type II secretion system secretin GspD [Deltaproteobacteria bacterium]
MSRIAKGLLWPLLILFFIMLSFEAPVWGFENIAAQEEVEEQPAAEKRESPDEKALYHVVRPGENLFQIGLKYNITVDGMYRRNNLTPNQPLLPGQRLLVSPTETQAASGATKAGTNDLAPKQPVLPDKKPLAASAEAKTVSRPLKKEYVTMNFKDVDLHVLIKFISELTGKNFLVDPAVRGKVTILSPNKVTVDAAYKVFQSILEVHGYTTVPSGKVIKIIPAIKAKARGVETVRKKELKWPEDKIITQLLPLDYADAALISKLLRPLIEKTGLLISYPETNTLIIIDVMSNINRLIRIINELDVPEDVAIHVFTLEYAKAQDLATKLLNVLQEKKGKAPTKQFLKIIPDERTNSLIALATSKTMADIEMLIGKLDQKQIRPRENIHIYHLENAVAEDLAKVLSEIPGKGTAGKKGKAPLISKDVNISADMATNTLVIIAEPDEYQILEEIIKKLDMPRTMVYVEALIMEVSTTKALELGVEWRLGNIYNGGYGSDQEGGFWFGGSTGNNARLDSLSDGAIPGGFVAGVIGKGITLGAVTFPTIGAFIRAVRSDSDFNILSTPQILTLDNEEAVIEVGQNIPFVTRVDQGTSVTDRAIQSFEYKDVGVTLKVTPQINNNRFVRLQVEQSTQTVLESAALGGTVLAPTTTFRSAKTVITVKDGETAVIGGLIQERMDRGKTQTPCLGGIPFLGWLFKTTSDRDEKVNLMVFLTPHIIENPEEGRDLYDKKKRKMDEERDRVLRMEQHEKMRKMGFE